MSAVGKTVHLNGLPFTIVGVAEESFAYVTPGTVYDISVPISQRRYLHVRWSAAQEDAGSWWIVTVARLKPGVSPQAAQSQVSALLANELLHARETSGQTEDAPAIALLPAQTALSRNPREDVHAVIRSDDRSGHRAAIGCANVAGLQLARAGARQ